MKINEKDTNVSASQSFVFYDSFKKAIDSLKDDEKLMLYEAITTYGLYRELPSLTGHIQGMFDLVKAQLDANFRKRENAKKGGAPVGNQNAKKKTED